MTSELALYEPELNELVKEYLTFAGLDKTVYSLHLECNEKGKPIQQGSKLSSDGSKLTAQNNILLEFDSGNYSSFWSLWEENVPGDIRSQDHTCQRLEFYIQIHFAVYPIRVGSTQSASNLENAMTNFKKYLETKGSELSQTTEFLPFYALPFVPNPVQHPSFKEIFSTYWVPDLRSRVDRFLSAALSATEPPLLITFLKNRGRLSVAEEASEQATKSLQQHLIQAEKRCSAYMKRFNKLQADYHTLISITAELVDSLEQTVHGRMVTAEYLQRVCARLFSGRAVGTSISTTSIDFTRPGTASSMLRASIVQESTAFEKDDTPLLPSLDYNKIKLHLREGSNRTKSLLLQALRWRLTRSSPGDQRDTVLMAFIDNDLFNCRSNFPSMGGNAFQMISLFEADDVAIRQYVARLYNAMASLQQGRAYLCMKPDDVGKLQKFLWRNRGIASDRNAIDHVFEEHLLGCLQKLSLRRQLQTVMIKGDLIRWLTTILAEQESLSDYMLEYAVALLMNLCLRSSGKLKCGEDAGKVLKVLSSLLAHENLEIRPYVNGALYSVLSNPVVRNEAVGMGLESVLRDFMDGEQEEFRRQLDFIIKQLNKPEDESDVLNESDDEGDEDDDEDQDAMEADLDKDEVIVPRPNEVTGEQLLCSEYLGILTNTRQHHQAPTNRGLDSLVVDSSIPLRPTTPGHQRLSASYQQNLSINLNSLDLSNSLLHSSTNTLTSSAQWQGSRVPSVSGSRPNTGSKMLLQSRENTLRLSQVGSASRNGRDSARLKSGLKTDGTSTLHSSNDDGQESPRSAVSGKKTLAPQVVEYKSAFQSRPRITRTPEPRSLTSSRNSTTINPTYSTGEPTSRPTSGRSWKGSKGSSGSGGESLGRKSPY
uniref:LisH domain-containing protein ARMC9 n=1 Tax=Phallusia mammillata TaxID=59560 RepID=A0A6F9D7C6_9ASCI|nr:lisH domain-containing protein ARMC9 [Phallusia mammillata]